MKVGEFFSLDELSRTDAPFNNEPGTLEVINLARLCCMVLDPLRRMAGPLIVTSGYRSQKVNEAVGGVQSSFHLKGLAADIRSEKHSPGDLARMLGGLEFDKAIDEFDLWLHVQIHELGALPRGELLKARRGAKGTEYKPL